MNRLAVVCVVCLVLFFASVSLAEAQDDSMAGFLSRETTVGVKGGLTYPGCVYIEDSDCLDSDVNWSLGGFLDYQLSPQFLGGVYLDLDGLSGDFVDDDIFAEVGFALKAQIGGDISPALIRPGFSVGLGRAFDLETTHLTIKGLVEVVVPTGGRIAWMGEAALWAGPAGGNEDVDVTFGPGVIVRGGVIF